MDMRWNFSIDQSGKAHFFLRAKNTVMKLRAKSRKDAEGAVWGLLTRDDLRLYATVKLSQSLSIYYVDQDVFTELGLLYEIKLAGRFLMRAADSNRWMEDLADDVISWRREGLTAESITLNIEADEDAFQDLVNKRRDYILGLINKERAKDQAKSKIQSFKGAV